MKANTFVSAAIAVLAASVHAQQNPGPSPTESVGCVAHGDHWDCEGPAVTAAPASGSVAAAEETGTMTDAHESHAAGGEDPGPSPTESTGCVSHGDHWDCEGPAVTLAAAATTTTMATAHESHAAGGEDPGPSPTESTGCVSHGDHWDCEGPAVTSAAAAATTTIASTHASHAMGGADAGPSPTESTGCVSHGDHWDCEGPAATVTTAAHSETHSETSTLATIVVPTMTAPENTTVPGNATTSATNTSSPTPFTGAATVGAKCGYGAIALIAGLVSMMVMSV